MSLPALYVLAQEYREAANQLADLELPPEVIADTLEGLAGDLEVKATNVAMFVRNIEATAEAIKQAEGEMANRRKSLENRAKHIRDYLKHNMEGAGISKIQCPHFVLAIQKNPPSVVIDAESQIPDLYMKHPEPPPPSPDKTLIAKAIKDGFEVAGAHLEAGTRLVIK